MDTKSAPLRKSRRQLAREQLTFLIREYLEGLATPRALSVWLMYSHGEHSQLVSLEVDPLGYRDPESFRKDFCATELLKKSDLLDTGIDTTAVALEKAREAERQNLKTNRRFRAISSLGSPLREPNARALRILCRAQKIIAQTLGVYRPEYAQFTGWSPGRTTKSFGPRLSALEKFQAKPDVTPGALVQAVKLLNQSPRWAQSAINADGPCSLILLRDIIETTPGNVALVVPKNAKTGRFICYEPHLNIPLQLSHGRVIRRKLKKKGIDLDDQSTNRRLALEGSRSNHLATIDLSSASDTMSTALVQFMLPHDWMDALEPLRSRSTFWPDVKAWVKNQKFSSMGNGYTFELESLVFFALAKGTAAELGVPLVPSGNFSVFGDDIIVPTSIYSQLVRVLNIAGFSTNSRKSFAYGPFRESCGINAFSGFVVNPPRVRPEQRGLSLAVSFHNRLREHHESYEGFIPQKTQLLLERIRRSFPGPFGPSGYGDGHYHVNFDEAVPHVKRAGNGWEGYWFKTRKPFTRSRLSDFLEGGGTFELRQRFEVASYLAATAPKKPRDLLEVLHEGGSYTNRVLRVLCQEWLSLPVY